MPFEQADEARHAEEAIGQTKGIGRSAVELKVSFVRQTKEGRSAYLSLHRLSSLFLLLHLGKQCLTHGRHAPKGDELLLEFLHLSLLCVR